MMKQANRIDRLKNAWKNRDYQNLIIISAVPTLMDCSDKYPPQKKGNKMKKIICITTVLLFAGCSNDHSNAPTELQWSAKTFTVPLSNIPEFDKLNIAARSHELYFSKQTSFQNEIMQASISTLEGIGQPFAYSILENQKVWDVEFKKCDSYRCQYKMLLARNLFLSGCLDKLKRSVVF